jgi:hypothetical protein
MPTSPVPQIPPLRRHAIRAGDGSVEFDCVDCGRSIVRFDRVIPEPLLCGACLHSPGWFNHPEVADLIDPEGHRRPPNSETYFREPGPA